MLVTQSLIFLKDTATYILVGGVKSWEKIKGEGKTVCAVLIKRGADKFDTFAALKKHLNLSTRENCLDNKCIRKDV